MFHLDKDEIVKQLIGHGAKVDAINNKGETPLFNATFKGTLIWRFFT